MKIEKYCNVTIPDNENKRVLNTDPTQAGRCPTDNNHKYIDLRFVVCWGTAIS